MLFYSPWKLQISERLQQIARKMNPSSYELILLGFGVYELEFGKEILRFNLLHGLLVYASCTHTRS